MANIAYLTSATNKTISSSRPSIYFRQMEKELGKDLPQILESNLIPGDAFAAGCEDRYDDFLYHRSIALDAAATRLARWPEAAQATKLGVDDGDDG